MEYKFFKTSENGCISRGFICFRFYANAKEAGAEKTSAAPDIMFI
jgi:hypothetical protein